VILGPKRLPDAGRALGQGLKEFKRSINGWHDEDRQIPAAPTVEADNPTRDDPPRCATRDHEPGVYYVA
jgi:Sec-independent protein translocase protein TatA